MILIKGTRTISGVTKWLIERNCGNITRFHWAKPIMEHDAHVDDDSLPKGCLALIPGTLGVNPKYQNAVGDSKREATKGCMIKHNISEHLDVNAGVNEIATYWLDTTVLENAICFGYTHQSEDSFLWPEDGSLGIRDARLNTS